MNPLGLWEPHIKDFTDSYANNFYWLRPRFLTQDQIDTLLHAAQSLEKQGEFKPAKIGKGDAKRTTPQIRSDKIRWIENFSSDHGQIVASIFKGLMTLVRMELFVPAKRFECHYSKYEIGDQYTLHRDRHLTRPGRLVSCVVYLTDCSDRSGNLILYDQDLTPMTIRPQAGTIVVFNSELEHQVTKVFENRWSLTGWLRDDLHPGLRL